MTSVAPRRSQKETDLKRTSKRQQQREQTKRRSHERHSAPFKLSEKKEGRYPKSTSDVTLEAPVTEEETVEVKKEMDEVSGNSILIGTVSTVTSPGRGDGGKRARKASNKFGGDFVSGKNLTNHYNVFFQNSGLVVKFWVFSCRLQGLSVASVGFEARGTAHQASQSSRVRGPRTQTRKFGLAQTHEHACAPIVRRRRCKE